MARESRRDRDLREARDAFCRVRRSDNRLLRWIAWISYRGLAERWDDNEIFRAHALLAEAEAWRRGFRPPSSFREALSRSRERGRRGVPPVGNL